RGGLSLQLLYVLLTVSAGSVAIRRPWPLVALGLSLAGFLGLASYGFAKLATIPVALALYLVAAARPRRTAVAGLIVAELLVGYALAVRAGSPASLSFGADWRDLWFGQSAVFLALWATGFMLRTRREYERGLHAQAERRAQAHIDEALHTVTQERMRIAR